MVQAVTELMEQRGHVVMGQKWRFAVHPVGKVADQMGHRGLQALGVGAQPAGTHIVHPGATTFAGSG